MAGTIHALAGALTTWAVLAAIALPAFAEPRSAALEAATVHLEARAAAAGPQAPEPRSFRVLSEYRSVSTGLTHLTLQQEIDGLDVWNGLLLVHVRDDGEVVALHDDFFERPAETSPPPTLTPSEAALAAARANGISFALTPRVLVPEQGASRACVLEGRGLSLDPIPAQLLWWPDEDGRLERAWRVRLRAIDHRGWWEVGVHGRSGRVLGQSDWGARDSYRALMPPLRHPDDGPTSLVVDPADPVASPFGWHDTNGLPGREFDDTRGNNTEAQDDVANDNAGENRPSGVVDGQVFLDSAANPNASADEVQPLGIIHTFAVANWLHDVHYQYGFDEAAGNFQRNNYGQPGAGDDPVLIDTQDGGGLDNAQFFTPVDGQSGRMELFLFAGPGTAVSITTPASIAGDYPAGQAAFGATLDDTGVSGDVVRAFDAVEAGPAPGTDTDACSAIENASEVAGRIALIDRGLCTFDTKLPNLVSAGAIGAIVVNLEDDSVFTMSGSNNVEIPGTIVGRTDGLRIRDALSEGVSATLRAPATSLRRDSAFSNALVIHEFGHGVTTRLTAGPASVNCLQTAQSRGLGEGWSDFHQLALTHQVGDTRDTPRPFVTWVAFQPRTARGLRSAPYSSDLAVQDATLADLDTAAPPHGVGEIWASALWEIYWDLIEERGFDPDWIGGTGGNNLAMQIVTDALKLQPCNPDFVEARDAVLLAEQLLTGGTHQCLLWEGFAKRGLGIDATVPPTNSTFDPGASFETPIECPEPGTTAMAVTVLFALACAKGARRPRC